MDRPSIKMSYLLWKLLQKLIPALLPTSTHVADGETCTKYCDIFRRTLYIVLFVVVVVVCLCPNIVKPVLLLDLVVGEEQKLHEHLNSVRLWLKTGF